MEITTVSLAPRTVLPVLSKQGFALHAMRLSLLIPPTTPANARSTNT